MGAIGVAVLAQGVRAVFSNTSQADTRDWREGGATRFAIVSRSCSAKGDQVVSISLRSLPALALVEVWLT